MATQPMQDDFEASFNEGAALDAGEVTEEMAAGLDIEDALEDQAEGEKPGEEAAEAAEAGGDVMVGETEMPAEAAPAPTAPAMTPEDVAKEMQRLKSWEGRLKAREAELKSREASGAAAPAAPTEDVAEAVSIAADAVESGAAPDDVMRALAGDFGQEFVQAISRLIEAKAGAIAERVADEKVKPVVGTVDQLIGGLTDERQRNHFETISDKHPDFNEVAQSPEFAAWVQQQGEAASKVVEAGTARQVVALLDQFKQAAGAGNVGSDADMQQAAESVPARRGLTLPTQPAASDDYEAAWKEFA